MNPYTQIALTFASGILIAAVTSWISVQLAIRQFYSQKWWERKADAYSRIIEALYHVKHNLETEMSAEEFGAQLSPQQRDEIRKKDKESFAEINKAEGMGAFIISKQASKILTQLSGDMEEHEDTSPGPFYEILRSDYSDIDRALKALREEAKRDLGMEDWKSIWSKIGSAAARWFKNVLE